eukprot:1156365-Pelagomonas_calceolata.AAC.5
MEAHPGQRQRSLALSGFSKRSCTEEDSPLLSVKQMRFTPEVQASEQQQEQEIELRAEAAARANAPSCQA